jgi:cobalt-zinc-cadmium resistance protein CzcA
VAEVLVDLKPLEMWRMGISREQLLEEMERAVSALPGMEVTFSMLIRNNVLEPIS